MSDKILKTGAVLVLGTGLAASGALAQVAQDPADPPGEAVKVDAQLLKDAEDISFSAQQLKPIALENLPAAIDLSTLPGTQVSATARTLRDLDPADIPATARTLGSTARGSLPGAAASRTTGARTPSLPSAAQNRGRGSRGR